MKAVNSRSMEVFFNTLLKYKQNLEKIKQVFLLPNIYKKCRFLRFSIFISTFILAFLVVPWYTVSIQKN